MTQFNNWEDTKIIRKDKILEFDFLDENSFITEIEAGYYYLSANMPDVEKKFYEEKNAQLADELDLKDTQKEITGFIKRLNMYNAAKDVAQTLMGKIADLRGVTVKDIHEEMGIPLNEDVE